MICTLANSFEDPPTCTRILCQTPGLQSDNKLDLEKRACDTNVHELAENPKKSPFPCGWGLGTRIAKLVQGDVARDRASRGVSATNKRLPITVGILSD